MPCGSYFVGANGTKTMYPANWAAHSTRNWAGLGITPIEEVVNSHPASDAAYLEPASMWHKVRPSDHLGA